MSAPQTIDDIRSLIEKSGLLPGSVVEPIFATGGWDTDQPNEPQAVARWLVQHGWLTLFQARQILAGKIRGFFLGEKYKVLDFLGAGGMGKVFLCEHLLLERLVAVKQLQLGDGSGTGNHPGSIVERFYREARAVASLDDPNIVRVFDVDRLGSIPFMVMEFVDGTNLHDLVKKHGPLSRERATHYISDAALGLQHAFEVGLIHRDIKPGNILLDRSGGVKLLDLGLARFTQDVAKNQGVTTRFDNRSVIGTADFIAPEQIDDGSRVDIRSDIYSLGCTFYFVLTGRAPFPDGTVMQKLYWHQSKAPDPLSELCPHVPLKLMELIDRMMAKEPKERPQTPIEVVKSLEDWTNTPIPPPPAKEMPRFAASFYRLGISGRPTHVSEAPPTPNPTASNDIERTNGGLSSHIVVAQNTGGSASPRMPNRPISANSLPARHHKHSKLYLIISGVLLLASGVIWMTMKNQTQPQTLPKGYEPPTKNVPFSGITLRGGGSTFVEPMLQRWAELYEKEKQVRIEYQGVGSGLGINGMLDKFYPFGCTDAALSDSRLATILKSGQEIVHIPLVMGAVVPTYNLLDVTQQLRFTGPVLADIFLGKITRWNDPAIQQSNPGVNLPDLAIIVVHREESSGTTFIWTDYLSKASAEWKTKIGANVLPSWPVGIHGKGNNGVSSQISRNVGSLGYVELTFALQNNLKFGMVRNFAGKFISPNLDSVTAAAAAHLNEIPDDLRFSLTDAPGDQSYPIAGTTWAILFVDQTQNDSASQLLEFLRWVTHEGQAHVTTMRFAPLPAEMIPRIDRQLSRIKVKAP